MLRTREADWHSREACSGGHHPKMAPSAPSLLVFTPSHESSQHRPQKPSEAGNVRRVQCLACSQITCPVTKFLSFNLQSFGAWYSVLWEKDFLDSAETSPELSILSNKHQWHLCSCENHMWRAPVNRNHLQWAAPLQRKLTHVLC